MIVQPLLGHYIRHRFQRLMHFDLGAVADVPDAGLADPKVLYIHIPFCESLCPFCSFHRVLLKPGVGNPYFRALREEIRLVFERGFKPSVVYVGGGTPTVLPEELGATLELVRSLFPVQQLSVETNPNHLNDHIIGLLQGVGVDRLSVGLQSFDNDLLKAMGRYHAYGSGQQIRDRLGAAQGRFGTLNADMIFNLPNQSLAILERDLHILSEDIGIDQVSCYPLMTSTRTDKAMRHTMGTYSLRNEKRYYDLVRRVMGRHYQLSSVWCYSRKGDLTDEYIIADTDYIGVGSGAFSYLNGVMYSNTFSIKRYQRWVIEKRSAVTARRTLQVGEQARYDLLMTLFGLTLNKGLLDRKYNHAFFRLLWREFALMKILGLIKESSGWIRLTRRGEYYWVVMMREFFTGVNNFRDQMRLLAKAELDAFD